MRSLASLVSAQGHAGSLARVSGERRNKDRMRSVGPDMKRAGPVLVAVVALAACGAPGTAPSGDGERRPPVYDGDWKLTSGMGPEGRIDSVPNHDINLLLSGDSLSGRSACNLYGGRAQIEGLAFEAGGLFGTEMGCEPVVMRAEQRYLEALQDAQEIERTDDVLSLEGPQTHLEFELLPAAPVASLTGTTWVLEGLVSGEIVSSTMAEAGPATLRLTAGGRIEGSTGCRSITGRWQESGSRIEMSEFGAEGSCPPSIEEQDGHVVSVLGDGFTAETEGGTLTLSGTSGGLGLVYRAK